MDEQPKKNPTNGDLYRLLTDMNARLTTIEQWKIAKDAAAAAVKEYQDREAIKHRDGVITRESVTKREVYKQLGYILGLVSLALYVYLSTKGVHP